jgi:tRNA-modifying protein YgfZ
MSLESIHQKLGATVAADGIPLHYGDLAKEYDAALNEAILLDRSHEGRVQLFGKGRFELLNRMSTNKMTDFGAEEGRGTVFINPTARIIDRIEAYHRPDHLLLLAEPARGAWLAEFLQKHIFFGDDAQPKDVTSQTTMLALHGPKADAIMAALYHEAATVPPLHGIELSLGDATVYGMRRKEMNGAHWALTAEPETAGKLYENLLQLGAIPAGSLSYNTLRIRAGKPARPELNSEYLPLEIGLWDEVHFAKGCYTGQEIIARMESRAKLAKTIVALQLDSFVAAPAEVRFEGRSIGTVTSSVQAPTGENFAIAIIKTQHIEAGTPISLGEVSGTVQGLLGHQAKYIQSL